MRKLLKKFLHWALADTYENDIAEKSMVLSTGRRRRANHPDELSSNGMSFNLYAAEGGTVIETKFYDRKNDETDHRLYIIPDGEDFSNVLGQIVSMERMKTWH
jgi:hypothetical protein